MITYLSYLFENEDMFNTAKNQHHFKIFNDVIAKNLNIYEQSENKH